MNLNKFQLICDYCKEQILCKETRVRIKIESFNTLKKQHTIEVYHLNCYQEKSVDKMSDKWGNVRINIKEDTRLLLDKLKINEKDTHNNVIERLIKNARIE